MNYFKIYYNLINNSLLKKRKRCDGYFEAHHVKPSCKNGKFMVLLTAREHFIAHLLLTKIYKNDKQLVYAFNMMFMTSENQSRYMNSKWFEYKRKLFSENHPCKNEVIKNKISESLKIYNKNKYIGKCCMLNTCKFCDIIIRRNKKFCSSECAEQYFINNTKPEFNNCKICNSKLGRSKHTCSIECFNIFKKYFKDYSMALSKSRSNYINNNYDTIIETNKKIAKTKDFSKIGKKISITKKINKSGNNMSSSFEIIIYDSKYNEINFKNKDITLRDFCMLNNYNFSKLQQSYLHNKRILGGNLNNCVVVKLKGTNEAK
jgi:predicted nucleic acid-binding Zn ribbon protein